MFVEGEFDTELSTFGEKRNMLMDVYQIDETLEKHTSFQHNLHSVERH